MLAAFLFTFSAQDRASSGDDDPKPPADAIDSSEMVQITALTLRVTQAGVKGLQPSLPAKVVVPGLIARGSLPVARARRATPFGFVGRPEIARTASSHGSTGVSRRAFGVSPFISLSVASDGRAVVFDEDGDDHGPTIITAAAFRAAITGAGMGVRTDRPFDDAAEVGPDASIAGIRGF